MDAKRRKAAKNSFGFATHNNSERSKRAGGNGGAQAAEPRSRNREIEVHAAADSGTNCLAIRASPETVEQLTAMIKQLDVDNSARDDVLLYRVGSGKTADLATWSNALFEGVQSASTSMQTPTAGQTQARGNSGNTASSSGRSTSTPTNSSIAHGGNNAGGDFSLAFSGQVRVIADATSNSVIILSRERNVVRLHKLLTELDQPIKQVMVRVLEAKVTLEMGTMTSRALVEHGQTAVIGGLIKNQVTETIQKVPLPGDLPFLGKLFRHTQTTKTQTELLVFLTPQVVRNPDELADLSRRLRGEMRRLDAAVENGLLQQDFDQLGRTTAPKSTGVIPATRRKAMDNKFLLPTSATLLTSSEWRLSPVAAATLAPTSRLFWLVLFLLPFFVLGCGDDRSAKNTDPQGSPWSEEGAPVALSDLAEDMLAYEGTLGRLPNDLAMLDRSGLISGGPYAKIGYAYHPTGIDVLNEGWSVMVADDRLRQADRLWCIVRPALHVSELPELRVVQISLDELHASAATDGGG